MSRIAPIDLAAATGLRKALLKQVHGAFGTTPDMFLTVAHSPAALESMWGSFAALGGGVLPSRLGEQIAVAVADRNDWSTALPRTPRSDARPVPRPTR